MLGRGEKKESDKRPQERIERGRARLQDIASSRDECWEFFRNEHYAYVDEKGTLQRLATTTTVRGAGKPRWRARQSRNLIFDVVLHEASRYTTRVPGYRVLPSTGDTDDAGAAKLSEKVARYGYDRWKLRRARVDGVIHSIVGGEAFAWPFFDNTVGPFIDDGVGQGEIRVRVFGSNECYWEPGLRFEDSPWHAVEHAVPVDQVFQYEGYIGPNKLTPDADSRSLSFRGKKQGDKRKLCLVTHYLERPCPKYPRGRWLTYANKAQILPEREYPTEGTDPCLRKLSYAPDPDSDRDQGLVANLLDAQRTYNDCNNKAVEWKNLCLLPRIVVTPGIFKKQRWTDEPGKVYEIPQPDQNFKVVDTPQVPQELFEMADRAQADIARIAAQNDIPGNIEAGKAIQALLERDQSRSGMFLSQLADWDAQIMHDCLVLAQKHYTEPRLIQIKGDFGWDMTEDFRGAQLRDQVDVRVSIDSIEPTTRASIEQRIMNYAQMGAIRPEEAMAAIEMGTAEAIVSRIVLDEERAGRIIQRIREGPESLFSMPELPTGRMEKVPSGEIDPMTGQPIMVETGRPEMAPGWMPRYSDNLAAFRNTFEAWMKTEEYERTSPEMQEAAANIYAGILQLEAEKAAEQQAAQMAQAEGLGMANAAKPAVKPQASLPSVSGNGSNQS